ncbi:MAG: hypothetical protein NUV65_04755 [Candidatus Roizmanbacteria bacterium]|nr:hypothetical protein [Candidatus Roizmanbacteria bacterium]
MKVDQAPTNWNEIIVSSRHYRNIQRAQHAKAEGNVNEGRFNRMVAFRSSVMNPVSHLFEDENSPLYDPRASVLVSGSSAAWDGKKQFRAGSDIDFLVMSEVLNDPDRYANFLMQVQLYDQSFIDGAGVAPVYFTNASSESDVLYVVREHWERYGGIKYVRGEDHANRYLPVHFLYYPGYRSFFRREPDRLANRLLDSSTVISGHKEYFPSDPAGDTFTSMMDMAKWELERHLANLILNYNILPHAFVFQGYADKVLRVARGPLVLDKLYPPEFEVNVDRTVELLDRDYSSAIGVGIRDALVPLLNIHKNGWPKSGLEATGSTFDDFVAGATTLMHLTNYLITNQIS